MNPLVFILTISPIRVMITPRLCYFHTSTLRSGLFLLLAHWGSKTILSDFCCILVTVVMAPVVRIEPNGCQALLSHDDAIDDLKDHGWDIFLKNLRVIISRLQRLSHKPLMVSEPRLETYN
jgi:hypothetical protein